jgi:hypothetical protein
MQILRGLGPEPERMAFSPDGRFLAVGGCERFHLWEPAAGPDPLWSIRPASLARNFVFTADSKSVLGGTITIGLTDVRTGSWREELFLSQLRPALYSPDSRFGLAVESDQGAGILRLRCARAAGGKWEGAWRKEIVFDATHGLSAYHALLFSADSGRLVRVFRRKPYPYVTAAAAEVFDAATGRVVARWEGELPSDAGAGAVSPAGVIVLLRSRALYAIDAAAPNSEPVKRLNATPQHFTAAAFSPDGARLATTSNDTTATVWDTTTWEVQRRYEWIIGRLRTVCFAPDGLRCAAGSDTGQIVVWDLDE